ncbi:MAG: CBS domain-containing protein [Nitrospiraceae bacterium]|nr:CBS domain-containing protein [Nitrospiraceae bacterium]
MPLFGELFISEIIRKPVLDPKGDVLGWVRDVIVVKGDPLPRISALIIEKKHHQYKLAWEHMSLFNKRIMSSYLTAENITDYEMHEDDLLALRDIFDKQIVDANGAKVVRVNDIKLEGYDGEAILIAVDVGVKGILRRLGIEKGSDKFFKLFQTRLASNLISWNYIQPLRPKLHSISLTVPRQMVSELHPADIADIISKVSREEGKHLFKGLDIETAAEALSELKPEMQAEIISGMDTDKAADLIEEMSPDAAADVLSDLPAEKAQEILEHVEKEDAEDIQELLGHEEDSAGGIMTTEYIAYPPDITVGETLCRFRKDAEELETVYYIYIVEDEKLIGATSLRELLLAEPDTLLSDMMETKLKTVSPDADENAAASIISKYNLVALPVVDDDGCLLGIVTVDDIIDRILPPAAKRKLRRI